MEIAMIRSWLGNIEFCERNKQSTRYCGGPDHFCDAKGLRKHQESSGDEDFGRGLTIRSQIWATWRGDVEASYLDKDLSKPLNHQITRKYICSAADEADSANSDSPTISTETSNIHIPGPGAMNNARRIRLVERLMEFVSLLENGTRAIIPILSAAGSNSSSSTGSTTSSSVSNKSRSSTTRSGKRLAKEESEEWSPDGNGNNGRSKKPKCLQDGTVEQKHWNFACPYRKHDPAKYGLQTRYSCALSGWQNVSRVKEHLYRVHLAPPHCQRCWRTFSTPELLTHHRKLLTPTACVSDPDGEPPEGITDQLLLILRRRKKSYPGQTEEDRWKEIYRMLFPGDTVPSPYFEPVQDAAAATTTTNAPDTLNLHDFAAYSRRETPRLVRSILENESESQLIEEPIINRIIQSYQERLLSEYVSQLSSGSSTATTTTATTLATSPRSISYMDAYDNSDLNNQMEFPFTFSGLDLNPNQLTHHVPTYNAELLEIDFPNISWENATGFPGMDPALSSLDEPDIAFDALFQ